MPLEYDAAQDSAEKHTNIISVTINEMEFLGSFWRSRLSSDKLGSADLVADFSINAARRLSLSSGASLPLALPPERLLVFPKA